MAIDARSDILLYDEPGRFSKPIGAVPVFTRSGALRILDTGRIYREITADKARRETVISSDSPGLGAHESTRALPLEPPETPANDDSVRFDPAQTAWSLTGGGTPVDDGAVTSIFDSLPTNGEARQFSSSGAGTADAILRQNIGSSTGSKETVSAIIEQVDAEDSWVRARDSTGYYVEIRYKWATDTLTETTGSGHVRTLAEAGPNGGKVIRLIGTGTGNNATTRQTDVLAVVSTANGTAIVHHAQHEERAYATSPIPYVGSPVLRPGEDFHYADTAVDGRQAIAGYLRFFAVDPLSAVNNGRLFGNWGSTPRFLVYNNTVNQIWLLYRDSGGNQSSANTGISASPGDLVEVAWTIAADGSPYLVGRLNGSGISSDSGAATANGLEKFASRDLYLNQDPDGTNRGAQKYERVHVVKASEVDAALDGTADQAFIGEVAAFRMNQQGEVLT